MRTRFRPTDDASGAPLQTLDFVHLPLPHFPPPDNLFSVCFLQCLNEIPIPSISPETEKLPIDDALAIFLSDVLPHFIDVADHEKSSNAVRSKETLEVLPTEEKDGANSASEGTGNDTAFLQFEIPEINLSLLQLQGSATQSQKESLDIFSKISDVECTMDPLSYDLIRHNDLEVLSVYSVDDMSMEYSMEQKADLLEDPSSVQGELDSHNIKFPLFEVDEESMGIVRRVNMVDEVLNFENIETQQLLQPDEEIGNKELLGSVEFDFMKDLLYHCVAKKSLEDTVDSSLLDCVSIIDLPPLQEYTLFPQAKVDDSVRSMGPIFDEFIFSDSNPFSFHEVFLDTATEIQTEACESMFGESMHFKNLNELIVSHELTLMDDSFKSLPVPILSDHGYIRPLHLFIEELFAHLDLQCPSASDGLYLDWYYLGEDGCDTVKYSSCWKMLWEIENYNVDAALNITEGEKLIFDFICYEDHSHKQNTQIDKEMLNLPSSDVPIVHNSSGKVDLTSLSHHGEGKIITEDLLRRSSAEKVQLFGESMTSDLDYFLNPRIYIRGKETIPASKFENLNTICQVKVPNEDSDPAKSSTMVQQKWDVRLHQIKLSDNIVLLIDYLSKHFLALLESNKQLIEMQNQYQAGNDLSLLHIPKGKLISRLKEKIESSTHLADNDGDIMVLASLCAIKQMAFYLCYYGVQVTYLYADKLVTNLRCLKLGLSFLYNMIREEHKIAEKELSAIHPSISIFREILLTNFSNNRSKVLIVSDQIFWWPLKRLMTSLNITYNEPQTHLNNPSQQHHYSEISDTTIDIMLHSDCCLVSHDSVFASFPFSKFSFILEYGGSNESSRISSICPRLDAFPTLYFIKVDLEESSIAMALSDGVGMVKSINLEMTKDLGSTVSQNDGKFKLESLLNTIPIKEAHDNVLAEDVNEDEDCIMMPAKAMRVGSESKINLSCKKPFYPETVIIVNTRNFNEEMVISRRSSYQRILEMERRGAQVVERDINLPVDLIVSAAVSVTWYDCKNIGKKTSASDEAFSCLPLCVESIAANILTSLSFAFSCCILIFEGEGNFLGSIMESSDELYAAAASLGIEIQIFCSYSPEMTDEIILSCINVSAKLSSGLYPKMPDSESLAESFLTAFPSINPLTAHAILSSGYMFDKFMELSNEGKIGALKKYQVPDESVVLLSATIRYGEREDCKSGTTDCSSSVSSVPDSENIHHRIASENKKPKYNHNAAIEPSNDLFHMGSLNLPPDDQLNPPPKWTVSGNSWLSGSAEISDKPGQLDSTFDEKLFIGQEFDAKGFEISGDMENTRIPVIEIDRSSGWRLATTTINNLSRQSIKVHGIPQDNFIGEVIDVDDTAAFSKKFPAPKSTFSPFQLNVEKNYAAKDSRTSEMSSRENNIPAFTNFVDIDSGTDTWLDKGFFEENVMEKAAKSFCNLSFQQTGTRSYDSTPLSNALHSGQKQQESPWTIEFLNKIREKSRLRQQLIPSNLSPPCFGLPENTSKVTKRKSPSIFELYKYEGSTPKKMPEKKRLKGTSQPRNSLKNDKASASNPPQYTPLNKRARPQWTPLDKRAIPQWTPLDKRAMPQWTPLDKRARRNLSFSTNGSGGQSKLVWSDNNSHTLQK